MTTRDERPQPSGSPAPAPAPGPARSAAPPGTSASAAPPRSTASADPPKSTASADPPRRWRPTPAPATRTTTATTAMANLGALDTGASSNDDPGASGSADRFDLIRRLFDDALLTRVPAFTASGLDARSAGRQLPAGTREPSGASLPGAGGTTGQVSKLPRRGPGSPGFPAIRPRTARPTATARAAHVATTTDQPRPRSTPLTSAA